MSQIEGWPKNHLSFLNFPPDFKSKQILIGQKQFFQCLHWLTAIQNKQKGGKFELDKSHLGHPSIRLNNIALVNLSYFRYFHFHTVAHQIEVFNFPNLLLPNQI